MKLVVGSSLQQSNELSQGFTMHTIFYQLLFYNYFWSIRINIFYMYFILMSLFLALLNA